MHHEEKRFAHATGSRRALADGKHSGTNPIRSARGRSEPRGTQDPWSNATTKAVVFEAKYVKRIVCGCGWSQLRTSVGNLPLKESYIIDNRFYINSCVSTADYSSSVHFFFYCLLFSSPIDHRLALVPSANRALGCVGWVVPLQCREKQGKLAVQARGRGAGKKHENRGMQN